MSELKPCEYCERVPVESLDPGVLTHIGINYCPMCGKPLSQAARETRRAGWVRCSERLPEPGVFVLAVQTHSDGTHSHIISKYDAEEFEWIGQACENYSAPTHYMPLPEPPEEGE